VNQYFLANTLAISETDDPHPDRRFCIFVGTRVFHGSERVARLLDTISQVAELDDIVARMTEGDSGSAMSHEQVLAAIETQLIPSGVVSRTSGSAGEVTQRSPYLFFSRTLISATMVGRVAPPLSALFAPATAIATVLLCTGLLLLWLVGLAQSGSISAALSDFDMSLADSSLFYLLVLVSFIMHEFGHAAASHRFGSRPAEIGIGLYLVFPVLFCNVTQAWRLPRKARVAVNLGGVYFQLIVCAVLAACQLATHSDVLTLVMYANLVSMLVTLNPFFRFDGYWIYSDLFRLPNLRDSAREVTIAALGRAARSLLRLTPGAAVASKPALRLYAWSSMLFFTGFIGTMLAGMWRLASTLPQLWGAALEKYQRQPPLEALVDAGGHAMMLAIYVLGCILTVGFIVSALRHAVLAVRQACSRTALTAGVTAAQGTMP
jgi:putative peptide zinc metalloprotease protein